MASYLSVLVSGRNYRLRYYTKEEFRARVMGETQDMYYLLLLDRSGMGDAYEEVSVDKRHVKLLEELPA